MAGYISRINSYLIEANRLLKESHDDQLQQLRQAMNADFLESIEETKRWHAIANIYMKRIGRDMKMRNRKQAAISTPVAAPAVAPAVAPTVAPTSVPIIQSVAVLPSIPQQGNGTFHVQTVSSSQ